MSDCLTAKNNRYLFLPIETKVREYYGKLLLSLIAAESGFSTILGAQRNIIQSAHLFPPGIYIDKSVAATKSKWVYWCKELGHIFTAWDEEGLVYFDDSVYHELRLCEKVFQDAAIFFTWGKAQADTILSKFPQENFRLGKTGNPRFDLMRTEVRQFFKPKAETICAQYGSIILINTNFGIFNHFHGVEKEKARLKKSYPIAINKPSFFDGWIKAQETMFHYFVESLPEIRKSFPKHTIIIRPHPSENFDKWVEIVDPVGDCHVNSEGNVLEWIFASDVLVHFNCTTAIEAYLMGVPAIAYRPEELGLYEQRLPNALSLHANDLTDLISKLRVTIQGEITDYFLGENDMRTKTAEYYIEGLNGPLASERIIDLLNKRFNFIPPRRSLKMWGMKNLRKMWLIAKKMRDGELNTDKYSRKKFPNLTFKEISSDIQRFQQVTGRFSRVKVQRSYKNCFHISSV